MKNANVCCLPALNWTAHRIYKLLLSAVTLVHNEGPWRTCCKEAICINFTMGSERTRKKRWYSSAVLLRTFWVWGCSNAVRLTLCLSKYNTPIAFILMPVIARCHGNEPTYTRYDPVTGSTGAKIKVAAIPWLRSDLHLTRWICKTRSKSPKNGRYAFLSCIIIHVQHPQQAWPKKTKITKPVEHNSVCQIGSVRPALALMLWNCVVS